MFLLSSIYDDYQCEEYSCAAVLGFFSTFDKANTALKKILRERKLDEKTGKEKKCNNFYGITFKRPMEEECYTIQEIEVDTILYSIIF